MPKRSVWLVRAALLYLVLGFTGGGLLLAAKSASFEAAVWPIRPLHVEFLLFGFIVQLAFGVALWILPRALTPQNERPGWWAGVLLNGGVWLAGLGGALGLGPMSLTGRLLELAAVMTFAVHVWPRVRERR